MKLGRRKKNAAQIEGPLITSMFDGAPYIDEPVYVERPLYATVSPETHKVLSHYRRVPLKWMR